MRDREGLMMVLYDLPVSSGKQRREVRQFRKKLVAAGYRLMQESVYVKLLHNDSMAERELAELKTMVPTQGTVSAMPMSLNVFRGLRTLTGDGFNQALFSDDLVVL